MNCPELETTSALFDGELDADAARAASAHAEACEECTAFLTHARTLRTALGNLTWHQAPARRKYVRLVPAFAVVLLMIVGAVWFMRPKYTSATFADYDPGRPPVVYVAPRGGR